MQDADRAAYRAALGVAHASMRALGSTSVAARFLWEGVRCTDWPAVHQGCSRILAVLTLRIDIDPDLPILVHSHPLHGPALNLTLAKAGTPGPASLASSRRSPRGRIAWPCRPCGRWA